MSESQHKFFRRNIELRQELGHPVTAGVLKRLNGMTKAQRRSMWFMLLRQKADMRAVANGTPLPDLS